MTSPFAVGHAGLVRLALRRALSPARLVLSALVLAPFVAWSLGSDAGVTDALERALSPDALAELRRHATRQGLWAAALAWLLPLFVVHAARTLGGFRRDELAWRANRPAGPAGPAVHVVTSWLGTLAGLGVALLLAAATVELACGGTGASGAAMLREVGALAGPDARWIGPGRAIAWRIEDPGRGAHVATIDVRVASGGPALDVAWSAQGRSGVERVHGRRTIELPFEGGGGAVQVELATAGGARESAQGVVGFVTRDGPGGPQLWRVPDAGGANGPDERRASANVVARALVAGAAWLALALAFGAWAGAGTASALALVLLAAVVLGDAPPWIPGATLARALAVAGQGRVPSALGPAELGAALVATVAGLALAALGLRRWRSAP